MEILKIYFDRRVIILLLFGIAAGLPLSLVFSTLSIWLAEANVSRSDVTFFVWATLAYSFKFIWSPLVDNLHLPLLSSRLGKRRGWLVFSQLGIISALILMASVNPAHSLVLMAIGACLLGVFSATQDIIIDAYRIDLTRNDYVITSASAAAYIVGYRIGMIISGAGALFMAQALGSMSGNYHYQAWALTYLLMAIISSACIFITLKSPEPETLIKSPQRNTGKLVLLFVAAIGVFVVSFSFLKINLGTSVLLKFLSETVRFSISLIAAGTASLTLIKSGLIPKELAIENWIAPLQDFFQRYHQQAIWLLLLVGFYKISDILLGSIANIFYSEIGFSKDEIASATKIFGLLMTISGGLLGGVLIDRFKLWSMMYVSAFLAACTNLLFLLLQPYEHSLFLLYLVICGDNLFGGIANTVFIAFLSSLTNIKFTATQYALFSSIMTLFPRLLSGYAGSFVELFGYNEFFIMSFFLGLPVLWLIYINKRLGV